MFMLKFMLTCNKQLLVILGQNNGPSMKYFLTGSIYGNATVQCNVWCFIFQPTDVHRTVAINCGYIGTNDYKIEPGDRRFMITVSIFLLSTVCTSYYPQRSRSILIIKRSKCKQNFKTIKSLIVFRIVLLSQLNNF